MPDMTPTLPNLKGRFPFRLGTSSYIIPADIEPNVRFLAPLVDDVELVLFESDGFSNLPSPTVIDTLVQLHREHDVSYTVHLPLDCQLGSPDGAIRRSSVGKCARVFDLTAPLTPHAYLLHLHGEQRGDEPARDVPAWQNNLRESTEALLAHGIPARKLAVETLDYPFELVEPLIREFDLGVCVDVGHLLLANRDPVAPIRAHRDRCLVIHLHGVRDGKDHVDVAGMDPALLRGILDAACDLPNCVVTLELFDGDNLRRSLECLEALS